ncbi:hypothetical protein NY588_09625 [Curtobacterium flaccumfaciens pv. beticola]|uniref:hypothetical protein n=1 Tax=Curtobacterium flaccumfaciens TaxID=2035 RepID=UPI00349F1133|nr:hypothetical protein [Curtobacterium flaccumfaciens pv. basellae]
MARIQVLELPSKSVGEHFETPFVLVIDQVEHSEVSSMEGVVRKTMDTFIDGEAIKGATGATSVIVTTETLDVVR